MEKDPNKRRRAEEAAEADDEHGAETVDAIYSKFVQTEVEETYFEGYVESNLLYISNLNQTTTRADVRKFFEGFTVTKIEFYAKLNRENKKARAAAVTFDFNSDEQIKEAINLNGKLLKGENSSTHVYVTRARNNRRTICVTGFEASIGQSDIKERLIKIFQAYSIPKSVKIFLPQDQRFAYVDMWLKNKKLERFDQELGNGLFKWNDEVEIRATNARLTKNFMEDWKKDRKRIRS